MEASITVNGVEYVRKDSVQQVPNGNRVVVVVDRGWIFAGDVTEKGGRIYLDRAVWVFRWEAIGFNGMLENPASDKVNIRKLNHRVDIPVGAEVYRVPVVCDWGL